MPDAAGGNKKGFTWRLRSCSNCQRSAAGRTGFFGRGIRRAPGYSLKAGAGPMRGRSCSLMEVRLNFVSQR